MYFSSLPCLFGNAYFILAGNKDEKAELKKQIEELQKQLNKLKTENEDLKLELELK